MVPARAQLTARDSRLTAPASRAGIIAWGVEVRLTRLDRLLWVWFFQSLVSLADGARHRQTRTVIAWHRRGFRLFWTWKSRHRTGRPTIPQEVRTLIRTMWLPTPSGVRLGFRRHIHGPPPATALADLAYVPDQPCATADRSRLLRGADGHVPATLRLGAARA